MILNFIGANGNTLPLIGNDFFTLIGADGITESHTAISSSTIASMDGDTVNNTRTQPRTIVLYFRVAATADVETVKRYVMQYVKPKKLGALYWMQNDKPLMIRGTVESIKMPRFVNGVVMQIQLHCSEPYWEDASVVVNEISEIIGFHRFDVVFTESGIVMGEYDTNRTRIFTNSGDVSVGMEIKILCTNTVVNPVLQRADGTYIGIIDTLESSDEVIINTSKGKKTITKNGVNILNKIKAGSTFLQLDIGENEFTIDADSGEGNMLFNFAYKQRYV